MRDLRSIVRRFSGPGIFAIVLASGGAAQDCAEVDTTSCLHAFYASPPYNGVPPHFDCSGGPGYTCVPLEQDVNFRGVKAVPVGWERLDLTGTSKTAHIKIPIGCLYDAGSGQYTCVYPEAWSDIECHEYSNPPFPRNCS